MRVAEACGGRLLLTAIDASYRTLSGHVIYVKKSLTVGSFSTL